MNIIPASSEHLPLINKIAHTTWHHTYSEILSEEQIKYMLEWMYSLQSLTQQTEKDHHHFLLIEEDDKYLGFVSYETNYNKLPKTKIHKLYILPEQQGKGIGRQLIDEVARIAKNDSQQSILLNMNKDNKAIHFYKKTGFEVVDEGCFDIGNGFFMDDYILEKKLT